MTAMEIAGYTNWTILLSFRMDKSTIDKHCTVYYAMNHSTGLFRDF